MTFSSVSEITNGRLSSQSLSSNVRRGWSAWRTSVDSSNTGWKFWIEGSTNNSLNSQWPQTDVNNLWCGVRIQRRTSGRSLFSWYSRTRSIIRWNMLEPTPARIPLIKSSHKWARILFIILNSKLGIWLCSQPRIDLNSQSKFYDILTRPYK